MWRMNKLIAETTGRRNEIKKQNMRDLFQCLRPLDGRWEEHDRESQAREWNRTGDEWSHCSRFSFPPFPGYELLYHDKRQDRCKWHIYIPSRQRQTWLNLDESRRGCVFYARAAAGEDGRLQIDEAEDVCLDAAWKMSPLVSPADTKSGSFFMSVRMHNALLVKVHPEMKFCFGFCNRC